MNKTFIFASLVALALVAGSKTPAEPRVNEIGSNLYVVGSSVAGIRIPIAANNQTN